MNPFGEDARQNRVVVIWLIAASVLAFVAGAYLEEAVGDCRVTQHLSKGECRRLLTGWK